MGIINVTPDSFSDGGSYASARLAIEHGLRLEDAGADLLDVGGESTRPYSQAVADEEELRRVLPVLEGLAQRVACPLSVDTSKSRVARAAIELGVEIVNDVTGLSGDPELLPLVAEQQVGVCAMHMQGTPQTMQDAPSYQQVVAEILDYLAQRRQALLAAGVAAERICLDPGIGFGKTHAHNLELLRGCSRFHHLGCPLLVGHSRKGMIGKLLGDPERERDSGTAGMSLALARAGVQVLRVHNVAATRDALLCFAAAGGLE
ncbi:MAG: dihydropteroate synthase [Planctomycetales bacterium]|nr:dihydropteroate synthase [Planctomycetales bacterium]